MGIQLSQYVREKVSLWKHWGVDEFERHLDPAWIGVRVCTRNRPSCIVGMEIGANQDWACMGNL